MKMEQNQTNNNNGDSVKITEKTETVENQEQILKFVDDKATNVHVIPNDIELLNDFNSQSLELREHTVRDFLSRPIRVGDFTWSSTQPRNTQIFSLGFPSRLLDEVMVAEKISGFTYLKGDIVIKLQINSQNFQSGILQMRYFPVLSASRDFNTQLDTMKQYSGLPGLDINIQSDEPMELHIPYIYPTDAYDLIERPLDWAQVIVRVYSPLAAGSSTNVSITVWAHFLKDTLKLSMPTSMISASTSRVLSRYYTVAEPQIKQDKVKKEAESASTAGGPISRVAGAISTVATMASMIPGLQVVAPVVAAVSGAVGVVAAAFGYSKPTSDQIPTQVRPMYSRGMANSDFPDSSTQVALMTNNSLTIGDAMYATEVDEMAIANIIRIPHFVDSFNFGVTDPVNRKLFQIAVNPVIPTTDGTFTMRTTSLGYIGACFRQWRGGLNYTFKFAKTQYHSGRLIFVWFNSELEDAPVFYKPEFAKNPSVVFDLHDAFEMDLFIPYIQANPWLDCHPELSNFRVRNGIIGCYVLNSLQAAPSASPVVECVVEMRAGSDFMFSIPQQPILKGFDLNPIGTYNGTAPDFIRIVGLVYNTGEGYSLSFTYPWNPAGADNVIILSVGDLDYDFPDTSDYLIDIFDKLQTVEDVRIHVDSSQPSETQLVLRMYRGTDFKTYYLTYAPNQFPVEWIMTPRVVEDFRYAEPQIRRDEAIRGVDGMSILPSVNRQDFQPDVHTVGESVLSVKNLLLRYGYDNNYSFRGIGTTTSVIVNANSLDSVGSTSASYISFFASAFRFWRGSRRFKVRIERDGLPQIMMPVIFNPGSIRNPTSANTYRTNSSTNYYFPNNEGFFEFSVPYYNRNRISITGDDTVSTLLSTAEKYVLIDTSATDSSTVKVSMYSNVGEDFTFGMWMSTPTMKGTSRA